MLFCDDIIHKFIKNLSIDELRKILYTNKIMYNSYIKYWKYSNYLNIMCYNFMNYRFNNNTNYKLRLLLKNVKSKFKYYNMMENIYRVYKKTHIYDSNNSNFLFGTDYNRKYISIRLKNSNNIYRYICFVNCDIHSYITLYSENTLLDLDLNMRQHTFKCGCSKIFTCSKNNFLCSKEYINNN